MLGLFQHKNWPARFCPQKEGAAFRPRTAYAKGEAPQCGPSVLLMHCFSSAQTNMAKKVPMQRSHRMTRIFSLAGTSATPRKSELAARRRVRKGGRILAPKIGASYINRIAPRPHFRPPFFELARNFCTISQHFEIDVAVAACTAYMRFPHSITF